MSRDRRWVEAATAIAIHHEQIALFGGQDGIRDEGLLESVLARPKSLVSYGDPDLATLAAAYAFGISRNHPFVDGNKRAAYVVMNVFLLDNGFDLDASDADIVTVMMGLAEGTVAEEEFAAWVRRHLTPL